MTDELNRISVSRPLSRLACCALIVVTSLVTLGCGGETPTSLKDQPIILTGTLAYQQTVDLSFSLESDEIIRIDIVELQPVLVDVTNNPNFVATIGFGLGQLVEGACITRQRLAAQEGGVFTFGLNNGDYCIQLADTGFFPKDAIVKFTLSISSTS